MHDDSIVHDAVPHSEVVHAFGFVPTVIELVQRCIETIRCGNFMPFVLKFSMLAIW